MAECLFTLSLFYLFVGKYAQFRLRWKYSLVVQFLVGWLVLELAWFHGLISLATVLMAFGDLDDWSFGTFIGMLVSFYNIHMYYQIHQQGEDAKLEFEKTLPIGLGENFHEQILPERHALLKAEAISYEWLKPFSMGRPYIESVKNITYGPNERNTLNLYKPKGDTEKPRPVMLQIHGGGWTIGDNRHQGMPLRNTLVEAGWVFVAINYRLSPKHRFPAHLIDCKQAVKWIKENITEHGGDPDFIMVTGGSAGGHLSSLVALTGNKHQEVLQPGFEDADTRVQGCISMYGVYDFIDRNGHRPDMPMQEFLEKNIMPESHESNPELWDIASPIAQADDKRPPFMVVHGELDTLSFVEDAKFFVKELRQSSEQPCVYTELPTTQHAMDIFYSPRCIHTVNAMHTFAEHTYSHYLKD